MPLKPLQPKHQHNLIVFDDGVFRITDEGRPGYRRFRGYARVGAAWPRVAASASLAKVKERIEGFVAAVKRLEE